MKSHPLSLMFDFMKSRFKLYNIIWLLVVQLTAVPLAACSSVSDTLGDGYSDSLTFARTRWTTQTCNGFKLHQHHFLSDSLFGSNQYISYLSIPPSSPRRLAFVADTVLSSTSSMALRYNAYAAVNGTFFDMDLGNPICYLRIDGQELGENTPGKTDTIHRKYYQYATLFLRNGLPRLVVPDSSRCWERSLRDSNIMTAGPMLIHQGKPVAQRDDRTFVTRRHNRTALGIRPDGTVLLVAVDGRFKQFAEGFSLPELTQVMLWLGCSEAVNLDGGGSTTMYVRGAPNNGIVNYPSDNCRFSHDGERPVSNILIVK